MDQLQYQLKSWDARSDVEREKFVCEAIQACRLVCNVIPPNDEEKLLQALQEIGVKHPVYNLCEMAFEYKLSYFAVKMLKAMCKYFEIPSKSRDTKFG